MSNTTNGVSARTNGNAEGDSTHMNGIRNYMKGSAPLDLTVLGMNSGTSMVCYRWPFYDSSV